MRKLLAVVAVVFLAAGVAQAQQGRGPSFPKPEELKEKCGFDEEQVKKAEPICTEYSKKLQEAMDKVKDAQDKKAAYGEVRTIRTEGMGKLKEICKDDEQKKKLDEAFPERKKKKTDNN
ncbi:MAG TPA: hypothetical protein VNM14_24790 [Planctomycetota bacterium]|jgi:hypothetical protein|nr:hypothetical protein [Planctomycetota bacterium]